MKPNRRGSWIGWLLGCCVLLAGCQREPPEQRLRAALAQMQAGLQARDPEAVLGLVAKDFRGPDGMDRDVLRRTMRLQLLARSQVGVTLARTRVEMGQGYATVRFDALLTGGQGGWLPDEARGYEVETRWRDEGGEWRLVSARWE